MPNPQYTLQDLLKLMARLRDPATGCPWDLEQTFASIVPHTLEEAYEVADCIQREDWQNLPGELGDLLFQVVFYARLGEEQSHFNFNDIIHQLTDKLIKRHPHVFPDGHLDSVNYGPKSTPAIKQRWEAIKQQERHDKAQTGTLADIPRNLPALSRAAKLTKRAARVGFDWHEASGVLDKIEEEIAELRQAIAEQSQPHIREELGDLLFAQVNLARKLGINPEDALHQSNYKFERRFNYIEEQVNATEQDWADYTLEQLDAYWEQAKAKGL